MCNRYRNKTHGPRDWTEDLRQIKIPLRFPDPTPNWREVYHPTDPAPVFRPIEPDAPLSGLEVATMRWDLIPSFWRKPIKGKFLATNARCETVGALPAFKSAHARRRCLVPADGFFEWSGEKGAKTKWLITAADQPWFCFAGIWDRAETADGPVESFSILTSAPIRSAKSSPNTSRETTESPGTRSKSAAW